ncbi:MAG TPA: protein-disulfide reductase DsbD N-terminal domain-containing protein, partial [Rhodanobacteraceae bacterium]
MPRSFLRALLALATAMVAAAPFARAQTDEDGLLPVEQAFKLSAKIDKPGTIALHWDIAPDYYLYRSRIKAKTAQDGATLGDLALPDGTKKHDEFLGDVEVYHKAIDATLPYTLADAATKTIAVTLTVQGCHEVDPKICYPPHPTPVTLDVPASSASSTPSAEESGAAKLGLNLEGGAPLGASAGEPLPPEQAFVFEAIAASPTSILARWTMPKGYYLYRDKSAVALTNADGIKLGEPQWPKGVDHTDEHFGTTVVYFDQVELPIPLARENAAAQVITLYAEYQGCQDNGICYPVMSKKVKVEVPAATAEELAAAKASFVPTTAANRGLPSPAPAGAASPASGRGESANAATNTKIASPAGGGAASATGQSEEQAIASNLSSNH